MGWAIGDLNNENTGLEEMKPRNQSSGVTTFAGFHNINIRQQSEVFIYGREIFG